MSQHQYYVIVKLKAMYAGGSHKYRTLKVTANSESGALYQAIRMVIASDEGPAVSMRVDWRNPMPPRKHRPFMVYDGLTRIR